jgi:hypothetical protein
MVYSLAVEFYSLGTSTTYLAIIQNFETTLILNTITYSVLLVIDVLFPLVLTVVELVIVLVRRKKHTDTLEDMLKVEQLFVLFEEFAKSEYSIENVACYNDIQSFKKNPSQQSLKAFFEKYMNGSSSVMEVNLSGNVCKNIVGILQSNAEITSTTLDGVESGVMTNMSDTYTRFVISSAFEKYLNDKSTNLELIEGKKG